MLQPHKRVSGGVKAYQKMKSSFFVRFYVMPPLTKGGHYISDYAESSINEFFSEIFTARELAKEPLPDYLNSAIEEILK